MSLRLEDLGEPFQQLIRDLRQENKDVDLSLFEYVSVKEMALVVDRQTKGDDTAAIWEELKAQLQKKRELKAKKKEDKKAEEDKEKKQKEEEEQRRKEEEEAEKKRKAEEEAAREREAARLEAERKKKEDEEEQRRKEEAEQKRKAEEEEAARQREEQRKQEEERERQRKLAEEQREREAKERELELQRQHEMELERQRQREREIAAEEERRRERELQQAQERAAEEERQRQLLLQQQQEEEARRQKLQQEQEEQDRRRLQQKREEDERRSKEHMDLNRDADRDRKICTKRQQQKQQWKSETDFVHRQHQFQFPGTDEKWAYFDKTHNQWVSFNSDVQAQLEGARNFGNKTLDVMIGYTPCRVDLHQMLGYTQDGQRFAVRRFAADDHTPAAHFVFGEGSNEGEYIIWSSMNPFTQMLERFPHSVSRVLEMKYTAGFPSVDILIMGALPFTIIFAEMKQINQDQQFRSINRQAVEAQWERFTPNGEWKAFSIGVNESLEEHFAAGEQDCVVVEGGAPVTVDVQNCAHKDASGGWHGIRRVMVRRGEGSPRGPVHSARSTPSPTVAAATTVAAPSPPRASPQHFPPSPESPRRCFLEIFTVPGSVFTSRQPPHLSAEEVAKGAKYPLAVGLTTVGRDPIPSSQFNYHLPNQRPTNGITLQNQTVSRQHVQIAVTPQGGITLMDMNSTSGTSMVSGGVSRRLAPQQEIAASAEQFFLFGDVVARFAQM
eukprot:TRINITY_DN61264_c0_g2_i2.p1 TRINITY_DN61264_c0_g2~~TRINITY_DN61264_c0_g2_i2.p1  ORF type:complete len:726 (+),score=146.69 TRINITY_DN61264_c0_g2_i2:34-2211(+)